MGFVNFLKTLLSLSTISTEITKPEPECPNCGIHLALEQPDEDTSFYNCPDCNGLWLREDVFGELLEREESELSRFLGPPRSGHTFKRSPRSRVCPNCENTMDNYQFNFDSGVWLDACPGRHGIWLDGGELNLCRKCKEDVDAEMAGDPMDFLDSVTTATGGLDEVRQQLNRPDPTA